ncbi:MAG: hypothetical protein HKO90_06405, partial [Flavobacteriaceae bacterium]|nr:hypothetical protein [Flavobacteriaceae bacterium]
VGCQNSNKTPTPSTEGNNLNIFFDGVIHESAEVTLVYSDSIGEDSLMQDIKGRPKKMQRISFEIPEGQNPEAIEFKMENVKRIDFDKVVFNRADDRIVLRDSAFLVYFKLRNFKVEFENEKIRLINDTAGDAGFSAKQNLISRLKNRY